MTWRMTTAALGVSVCVLPAFAHAALPPQQPQTSAPQQTEAQKKCMADLKKAVQEQMAKQQPGSTAQAKNTKQPSGTIGTFDKCTYESIRLEKGKLLVTQTGRLPDSKKQCKPNQCDNLCKVRGNTWIGGTVTVAALLPNQKPTVLSKCDPKFAVMMSAFVAGQSAVSVAGDAIKDAANAIGNGYEIPQDVKDRLSASGFDYKQIEQVATKINENPEKVDEMLEALASGDQTKVKAAAESLGLSEEQLSKFKDNVAEMTPEKIISAMPPEVQDEARKWFGAETFGASAASQQDADAKPLRGGPFGELFAREAAKYPNLPKDVLPGTMAIEDPHGKNNCSHVGACGIFQYTPGTWNTWSSKCVQDGMCDSSVISQNMRYNPEAAASVTAYYMSKNMEKYSDLIERSGMNPATALYMIHNLGDSGGPRFIRAYTENPDASIWSGVTQKEAVNNPLLYKGMQTLADVEQNVTRLMAGDVKGFSGRYAVVQQRMGSPFASLNPFNSSLYSNDINGYAPYSYSAPVAQPMGVGYPASAVQQAYPQSYQQPPYTSGQQPQTQLPPPPPVQTPAITPVATLIAPMRVSRGGTIVLSWSSIGMMRGIPCVLSETAPENVKLAESNGGEYRLKVATSSTASRYAFTLKCTSAVDASAVLRSASVVIE